MSDNSLEKKGIKIYGGLNETPKDARDVKFGALYGLPALEELPLEFMVTPLAMKDQTDLDFCTGYGTTEASEVQEGVELSPEFQFAMTKKVTGEDPTAWGANIRDALKSAVKIGSLEQADVPANLLYNGRNRDFIANPANWPQELVLRAAKHKKKAFASAEGQYDMFDNIRATLWAANKEFIATGNKSKQKIIVTGSMWRQAWTIAPEGIIPEQFIEGSFGHCFDIVGWKVIGEQMYLVALLSNGNKIGVGGYYFFSPNVVNREFVFGGAWTLIDEDPETVKQLTSWNLSIQWKWLARIVVAIRNVFKKK